MGASSSKPPAAAPSPSCFSFCCAHPEPAELSDFGDIKIPPSGAGPYSQDVTPISTTQPEPWPEMALPHPAARLPLAKGRPSADDLPPPRISIGRRSLSLKRKRARQSSRDSTRFLTPQLNLDNSRRLPRLADNLVKTEPLPPTGDLSPLPDFLALRNSQLSLLASEPWTAIRETAESISDRDAKLYLSPRPSSEFRKTGQSHVTQSESSLGVRHSIDSAISMEPTSVRNSTVAPHGPSLRPLGQRLSTIASSLGSRPRTAPETATHSTASRISYFGAPDFHDLVVPEPSSAVEPLQTKLFPSNESLQGSKRRHTLTLEHKTNSAEFDEETVKLQNGKDLATNVSKRDVHYDDVSKPAGQTHVPAIAPSMKMDVRSGLLTDIGSSFARSIHDKDGSSTTPDPLRIDPIDWDRLSEPEEGERSASITHRFSRWLNPNSGPRNDESASGTFFMMPSMNSSACEPSATTASSDYLSNSREQSTTGNRRPSSAALPNALDFGPLRSLSRRRRLSARSRSSHADSVRGSQVLNPLNSHPASQANTASLYSRSSTGSLTSTDSHISTSRFPAAPTTAPVTNFGRYNSSVRNKLLEYRQNRLRPPVLPRQSTLALPSESYPGHFKFLKMKQEQEQEQEQENTPIEEPTSRRIDMVADLAKSASLRRAKTAPQMTLDFFPSSLDASTSAAVVPESSRQKQSIWQGLQRGRSTARDRDTHGRRLDWVHELQRQAHERNNRTLQVRRSQVGLAL